MLRNHMTGETAIQGMARESGRIAQVLAAAAAIEAAAARMRQPGDADPCAWSDAGDAFSSRLDDADNLVPRDDGRLLIRQLSVDDMQVCAAHGAGFDPHTHLARAGRGNIPLFMTQRLSGLVQDHCLHAMRRRWHESFSGPVYRRPPRCS